MDGHDLVKFLRAIGVPLTSKIKPDSLDSYMKQKGSRAFLVGICRSVSSKNVIFEEEIETEKLTNFELQPEKSAADLDGELCKLAEEVQDTEIYLHLLENENLKLQESIKCLSLRNSKSKNLSTKLSTIKDDMFSKCKGSVTSLKKDTETLKGDYSELYKLMCKNDADPLLLYQLPLDTYLADKKVFENHIKTFIIKQFEERIVELAGENQPSTCDQKNPRELEHLVSGPHKDLYNQQLQQLDQLEISFAESLYVTLVQEAKIAGLEAGIKKAKQIRGNSLVQRHFNSRLSPDAIQLVEERVHSAAKDCIARRIGMVVVGNYAIKQRRQNYYLEKLNTLENMLQKQLALDKLLCIFLQLEGAMVNENCSFMENTQHVITDTVNSSSLVLSCMDECKFRSLRNGSDKDNDRFMQYLLCLLPDFANINEAAINDLVTATSLLNDMLQHYELQLVQHTSSHLQGDERPSSNIWTKLSSVLDENSINIKPNLKLLELKHQLDLKLKEFCMSCEHQSSAKL